MSIVHRAFMNRWLSLERSQSPKIVAVRPQKWAAQTALSRPENRISACAAAVSFITKDSVSSKKSLSLIKKLPCLTDGGGAIIEFDCQ
jgi:hypothetical protein